MMVQLMIALVGGRSVAAFGDTLVVGAYYDNDNEDNSGSAYYIYYIDIQTKE